MMALTGHEHFPISAASLAQADLTNVVVDESNLLAVVLFSIFSIRVCVLAVAGSLT